MHAKSLLDGPFVEPFSDRGGQPWRFAYARRQHGRYRHVVALQIAPDLDDQLTLSLLRSMQSNEALSGLVRGVHYQWGGAHTIGFRSKDSVTKFLLFVLVD